LLIVGVGAVAVLLITIAWRRMEPKEQ